jgi:phosphomannomutase
MKMVDDTLSTAAQRWLALDPDAETRAELSAWLADPAAGSRLAEAFSQRLAFGTAGLRGAMGPGPNRMNRLLVRQVTLGLGRWLLHNPDAAARGVVVGMDARRNSAAFAQDVAEVLSSLGIRVWLAPRPVPTPLVGYAVLALGAAAGVVVTASHNPPADNGYKVFRGNGAQIIEPDDSEISAAIDAVALEETLAITAASGLALRERLPDAVVDGWHAALQANRTVVDVGARVVYTAMHGVGAMDVGRALQAAGHTDLHVVTEQIEPDGRFPTVTFPNPEEPGALDLALSLAERVGADVVLANDPDADRLAVAARDALGVMRPLSGNQVGVLLAEHLLSTRALGGRRPMVATTIVSTAMLSAIAAAHGAAYAETLTGFKWIGHAAIAHEAGGGAFVLGFEEALGYSAGSVVRDKDGVGTLLLAADFASHLKARGQTLWDAWDDLVRRYGFYLTRQRSLTLAGPEGKARIARIMASFRTEPPAAFDGLRVRASRDLLAGTRTDADGVVSRIDLPPSDVLAFDLEGGSRVLVRPSGTEPKIKIYFEVCAAVGEGTVADASAAAEARIARMMAEVDAKLPA